MYLAAITWKAKSSGSGNAGSNGSMAGVDELSIMFDNIRCNLGSKEKLEWDRAAYFTRGFARGNAYHIP